MVVGHECQILTQNSVFICFMEFAVKGRVGSEGEGLVMVAGTDLHGDGACWCLAVIVILRLCQRR